MIFAFANPKGGVGKSTLAVHAAVWLLEHGANVAFADADGQASSSIWLKEAAPNLPLYRLTTAEAVLEVIPKIQSEFDHVIIDAPGYLSDTTRTILLLSDMAYLPCGPTALDLWASSEALKAIRQAQMIRQGPPSAVFIPNKIKKARKRMSQEFQHAADSLGIGVVLGIRDLQSYADSPGQGSVVWRMGPSAKEASIEIQQLFEELFKDVIAREAPAERRVENG